MDADQKSSIVVPSATVVPLTSMIQNNADNSGRARISQRKRTLRWPRRALIVGHVTTGASSDKKLTFDNPVNVDHSRIDETSYCYTPRAVMSIHYAMAHMGHGYIMTKQRNEEKSFHDILRDRFSASGHSCIMLFSLCLNPQWKCNSKKIFINTIKQT